MTEFKFEVHKPFSTFTEGRPTPIPYVIDGLLPESAFSVLGAKPKHGKSSMSRIEGVQITKGLPFLDRPVERGEVLLCSLEDPRQHIDNSLRVLGYDPAQDEQIHIVTSLPRDVTHSVEIISDFLHKHENVRLVVLDTLAKVIRAQDSGNYDEMLHLCEQLHKLAREHTAHIQALTHCKKVQPDDPFDGFMGSAEVRAETDTNIVIFDRRGDRFIQSETRMGIPWDATLLSAETTVFEQSKMVMQFRLGKTFEDTTAEQKSASEQTTKWIVESRLLAFLKERGGHSTVSDYANHVIGGKQTKLDVMHAMAKGKDAKIRLTGVARSTTNPLMIHLVEAAVANESKTFNVCKDSDCTNEVAQEGDYCSRHKEWYAAKEAICVK